MVNVGIIGLGANWETRYAPVFKKFHERIAVRAICDAVPDRADQVAAGWNATAVYGAVALLERPDINAVIVLDPTSYGLEMLRLICAHHKPAYLAGSLGCDLDRLSQLHSECQTEGLTFMPEFGLRYTPATGRLHELIATQIGRPKKVVVTARYEANGSAAADALEDCEEFLTSVFDWFRYVIRTAPTRVRTEQIDSGQSGTKPDQIITVDFHRPKAMQQTPRAELHLYRHPVPQGVESRTSGCSVLSHQVECERGTAEIPASIDISWATTSGPIQESLAADRPDVEVMLDHFCRRVAGGLIPVADLADVCRGLTLTRATAKSLQTGQAINMNGNG
jgi:hypothetical protein